MCASIYTCSCSHTFEGTALRDFGCLVSSWCHGVAWDCLARSWCHLISKQETQIRIGSVINVKNIPSLWCLPRPLWSLYSNHIYSSYALLTEKLPTLEPRSWMVRPEAASTKPLLFCTWFYIQHRAVDHLLYIYPPRFGWQFLWHMSTHRP